MKYMMMMFGSAAGMAEEKSPEWITEMVQFMRDFNQELVDSGEFVFAEGLQDGSTAKLVTLTAGAPVVTDGPYSESKESVIGFWIVDVADEARVLELAGRIVPWSQTLEVRPVGTEPEPV